MENANVAYGINSAGTDWEATPYVNSRGNVRWEYAEGAYGKWTHRKTNLVSLQAAVKYAEVRGTLWVKYATR